MSGNQLPDITLNKKLALRIGAAARKARKAMGLTQAQAADRLLISTEFYCRIERGHSLPSTMTLSRLVTVLRFDATKALAVEMPGDAPEDVPPEPLGHDVESVEDDPADNTSSPYCPVCGQRRALCERNPKCAGAKALARMFPASLSGQTRKGWLDFITRGCASLRRDYPLAKLWLVATGKVPAVVDSLGRDDDLVVML